MSELKFMLDTNIFNRLLDNRLPLSMIEGKYLITTHIQLDEISKTPNEIRRAELESLFKETKQERVPTESSVWDVSRWDNAKWTSEDSKYPEMLARLSELDKKSKKNAKEPETNRARDILIAETAIANGICLITADRNLATLCTEFGGSVETIV